ncbi:putative ribonuclease H protein [Sesamum angolense]|uniref:Ribonuclease H protein n=1 Tax=Sesamum angolense TaxID=2727404 RepID=A0AAE1WG02_9LAMI|nr:putative ribonuclease H protein [Sesamum angolense]
MESVRYYWHEGDWNVPRILQIIPMPFAQTICQISIAAGQGDKIVWTGSSTGDFSTKSTWEAIRQVSSRRQLLADVWHGSLRPTISVFLWRLFQDRIPVDARMRQKGFSFPSKCQCCEAEETVSHLFIDSAAVQSVWQHFAAVFGLCLCDTGSLTHMYRGVPFSTDGIILEVQRHLLTLYAARTLTSTQWKGDLHQAVVMGFIFHQQVPRAPSIVRWRAPSPSWFKLNTDGSSLGNPGLAGAAGIIRDSAGHVHLAYQFALGTGTSVLAELTAFWRGMELALTHGLAPLVVEVDATTVISLLKSCASGKWEVRHLIMRIVYLQQLLVADVQHVFREANGAADHLAKEAASLQLTRVLHHDDITGVLRGILCLDR